MGRDRIKKLQILGMIVVLSSMALAWIFFSWKLTLVLMLVLWGNNMEQSCKIGLNKDNKINLN